MDRNNPDSAAFTNPSELKGHVNLRKAAPGENGAERGRKFSVPAAAGLTDHFAAGQADEEASGAVPVRCKSKVMVRRFVRNLNGFEQCGVQTGKVPANRVPAHDTDSALREFSSLPEIRFH